MLEYTINFWRINLWNEISITINLPVISLFGSSQKEHARVYVSLEIEFQ
jgi:hypothetical protein